MIKRCKKNNRDCLLNLLALAELSSNYQLRVIVVIIKISSLTITKN